MNIYYTDGSTVPNPGPGGFAVVKNMKPHIVGIEKNMTTNIRMEGMALMSALEDAKGEKCLIYTDSLFWVNVISLWAPKWEEQNWKKPKGKIIKNLDIVQPLYALYKESAAKVEWVKGHDDSEGNILADEWANRAREGEKLA